MNVFIKGNTSNMRGPCDSGFHIPTKDELTNFLTIAQAILPSTQFEENFITYLKMPRAEWLSSSDGTRQSYNFGWYHSCSIQNVNNSYALKIQGTNNGVVITSGYFSNAFSIRPFKDTPVVPDSGWTALYSDKIYHNSTLGLISISSDGVNWTTISDKNLGATTVYNSGDTMSEANCGKFYQWGNNYGFPFTGATTTSSSQVDASSYGPGNYYSSSTFITYHPRDSSDNYNLRGGETGGINELKNAYIGEYSYSIPIDGLLAYYPLVSDAKDHKADIGATGTTYNGTWVGTANYGTVGGKTAALFSRGSNRINTGLSRNSLPTSICATFYHTTNNDWETIMGNPTGNNSNGFALRYVGSANAIVITNGTGTDNNATYSATSNVWHSVVMTIQSGTTKVYFDGNLVYTLNSGNGGGSTFYIASYGAYTTYGWNGYIKDVAIYNKVLSADEVSRYHQVVTK